MDAEREHRIREVLDRAGLDGLLCTIPSNVLMLSGYWPVVGGSVAIFAPDGRVGLVVPSDEHDLANSSGAAEIRAVEEFEFETVRREVSQALRQLGISRGRLGCDTGPFYEPTSYIAMRFWGASVFDLAPEISVVPAADSLAHLRSVLTRHELEGVRRACRIAAKAFVAGAQLVAEGCRESQASMHFEAPLRTLGIGFEGVERAGGHVSVASGPNSGRAYGAYARSSARCLQASDLVLVHCNSFADGYWTDITRTFSMGAPGERSRSMYQAVFEARSAALAEIRPGVQARAVDAAARTVMAKHGFARQFRHPTGHGVGFAAIDHRAPPQISADSADVLQPGMVFNIEPAVYFENFGGIRQCDMVAVTDSGVEVLTPFQSSLEELIR